MIYHCQSLKKVTQYWFRLFPIHQTFRIFYNAHFYEFECSVLPDTQSQKMGIIAGADGFVNGNLAELIGLGIALFFV